MSHPCLQCGLRYSSYCMGCELKLFGVGMLPIPEQEHRQRKRKDADENGQTCTFDSKDESMKP